MATDNSTPECRICTHCKRSLPETPEYFAPAKNYQKGLNSQCRDCILKQRREREGWTKERKRSPKPNEGYLYCTYCDQQFPATQEWFNPDPRYKSGFKPTCRSCQANLTRENRIANPERTKRTKQEWNKNNPDKVRKHRTNSQKRNRASANKRIKRYNQRHPEIAKLRVRIQWHRRRTVEGRFVRADIQGLYEDQHGLCGYCGIRLFDEYHIDHILPVTKGGTNDIENLILACPDCNFSKGDRLLSEWEVLRGW